jgi:fatty-acid peroxygenase
MRADVDERTDDVPRLRGDQSLAFRRDGYDFGNRRFQALDTDVFRTRLLGRAVTFVRGMDAAEFFYTEDRFTRVGGIPRSAVHSLQDEGSVQTLDGPAHRHRCGLFLEALDATETLSLPGIVADMWGSNWQRRTGEGPVSIIALAGEVLTAAALAWAGIPTTARERRDRTTEFLAMIAGAGSFGPRNWSGRALRRRTETWARRVIRERRDEGAPATHTPVDEILAHREEGEPLDAVTAAIELLNLLRPTVAVSRFVGFAALALHLFPQWRERLAHDDAALLPFCTEVRRAAPFFPAIGGRATVPCSWRGIPVAEGDWVVLDIFATHRDPKTWRDPDRFDPQRFVDDPAATVIAQGAGSFPSGHRCPGEPATVDILALITRQLVHASWEVPDQDLRVDLRRMPATPGAEGLLLEPR